jgi:hypothetical protein
MIDTKDSTQEIKKAQDSTLGALKVLPKLHLIGDEPHEYSPEQAQEFLDTVFHVLTITRGCQRPVELMRWSTK